MKKTRMIWFSIIVIVIGSVAFAIGRQGLSHSELLSQLQSDDWQQRAVAAEKLIDDHESLKSDVVRNALIDLVEKENGVIASSYREGEPVSVKYGEGYSEYYSELLGAVTEVADFNDRRTLDVLARGSYNPDSAFAMKLAGLGQAIVPTLLEQAKDDFAPSRENALAVLGEAMKQDKHRANRMPTDMYIQAKQKLIEGTNDEEFWVRIQAVRALGQVGDKDLIPLLESISLTDPATVPAGEGDVSYPVRIEAHKALSVIRKMTDGRSM